MVGELGVRVVGINLVPAQIYTARRTAYLLGLSHLISFERQDFTKTSFPEGSFEVVWALESVCHTQDKQGFLTEARRLLKLGGRLVVADMFRTQRPLAADEVHSLRSWLSGWAVPDLVVLRCPVCEERVVLLGREDDWLSKGRQDFACGGCERQLTMAHRVEDIDGGLSANSLTRLPAS